MSDAAASASSHDSRPVPDPTVLSTIALDREIEHVTELLRAEIAELRTEMHGNTAVRLQMFGHIDELLRLAETRRVELKEDTERQVSTALAAAKADTEGLRREMGDLKDRVTEGKGQKEGSASAMAVALAVGGFLVGVVGIAVAIIASIN